MHRYRYETFPMRACQCAVIDEHEVEVDGEESKSDNVKDHPAMRLDAAFSSCCSLAQHRACWIEVACLQPNGHLVSESLLASS